MFDGTLVQPIQHTLDQPGNMQTCDGGGVGGQCDVNIPSLSPRGTEALKGHCTARVWTLNPSNNNGLNGSFLTGLATS